MSLPTLDLDDCTDFYVFWIIDVMLLILDHPWISRPNLDLTKILLNLPTLGEQKQGPHFRKWGSWVSGRKGRPHGHQCPEKDAEILAEGRYCILWGCFDAVFCGWLLGGFSPWANGIDDYFQNVLSVGLWTLVSLPKESLFGFLGRIKQPAELAGLANGGESGSSL